RWPQACPRDERSRRGLAHRRQRRWSARDSIHSASISARTDRLQNSAPDWWRLPGRIAFRACSCIGTVPSKARAEPHLQRVDVSWRSSQSKNEGILVLCETKYLGVLLRYGHSSARPSILGLNEIASTARHRVLVEQRPAGRDDTRCDR